MEIRYPICVYRQGQSVICKHIDIDTGEEAAYDRHGRAVVCTEGGSSQEEDENDEEELWIRRRLFSSEEETKMKIVLTGANACHIGMVTGFFFGRDQPPRLLKQHAQPQQQLRQLVPSLRARASVTAPRKR